jgi:hypothetical protein
MPQVASRSFFTFQAIPEFCRFFLTSLKLAPISRFGGVFFAKFCRFFAIQHTDAVKYHGRRICCFAQFGLETAMKISSRYMNKVLLVLSTAVVIVVGILFGIKYEPTNEFDPDRYYHFAVSAITSKEFAPPTLPQVEGLNWGNIFYEKEFLFHVYTGLAWRMGHEQGVINACLGLGVLVLLALFFVCARRINPVMAMFTTLAVTASSQRFMLRMFMVRPHVLAIFLTILIVWAILERRPRLLGLLCVLFALSYHGIYFPIIYGVIGIVAAFAVTRDRRSELVQDSLRCLFYAAAGICVGVVLNPYFPSNIMMTFQHFKIGLLAAGIPIQMFGGELHPFSGTMLLTSIPGFFFIVAMGLVWIGFWIAQKSLLPFSSDRPTSVAGGEASDFETLASFIFCTLFLVISIHNPRGIEFLIPFSVFFMVYLAARTKRPPVALFAMTILVVALQSPGNYTNVIGLVNRGAISRYFEESALGQNAKDALSRIPVDSSHNKVVNCSWDVSPYLFYARPDLHFIDLLDPSFLHDYNRQLYDARLEWNQGTVPDTYGMLKDGFNANYIFCRNSPVVPILVADPNITLIYPKTILERKNNRFYVFAMNSERRKEFVSAFSFNTSLERALRSKFPDKDAIAKKPVFVDWPAVGSPESENNEIFLNLNFVLGIASAPSVSGKGELKMDANSTPKTHSINDANGESDHSEESPRNSDPVKPTEASVVCTDVVPKSAEIQRLAGSTIIGLGGGPHLELWVDGVAEYSSVRFSGPRRIIHTLVELRKPTTGTSNIRLRVCGIEHAGYFGVSLSLWKLASLESLCKERFNQNIDFILQPNARHRELADLECIGTLASPNEPRK